MLVLADGSIRGTVGGGVRESEIVVAARELHERGGSRLLAVDFEEGLAGGPAPVCGGHMDVFLETIDAMHRVIIAGAGHIGYFLHRFLTLLDVRTIVVDPRAEFASGERFPGAERRVVGFEEALDGLALTAADGVVIVTKGHAHDECVLRQALATAAGFIGMIGSRRKVATVFERLRSRGFSDEQLARVRAPVGLDIGAETPAEIALAITAQIVATFRGHSAGA